MIPDRDVTQLREDSEPPKVTPRRPPIVGELVSSLVINMLAPVGGYFLLRPHVSSDTIALAVVTAIPVLRTLGVLIWRRKVDWIGILAAVGLGMGIAVSLFTGGGSLPLKFNEAMVTGVLGLACLVSVAVGKPLHGLMMKSTVKQPLPPQMAVMSRNITLLMGVTFLVHCATQITFALTLPTGQFLIVSRVVGWSVLLVGAGAVYLYVKRRRKMRRLSGTE